MKNNLPRIICLCLLLVLSALSFKFQGDLMQDKTLFDKTSYWGIVATIAALIIAIAEIINSINIARTIRDETVRALRRIEEIQQAASLADCLGAIDAINRDLMNEEYHASLVGFQNLRRAYKRNSALPPLVWSSDHGSAPLNKLELSILQATKSSTRGPLNKAQKQDLIKMLMDIKQSIESVNVARSK